MRKIRPRHRVKRHKDEKKQFFSDKENQASESGQSKSFFQPKLEIGDPSDTSEKQADKMADEVTHQKNEPSSSKAFGNQTVQRESKEKTVNKKIRRQPEEEEPAAKRIQRQAEEEEEPAAKLIHRQTEEEEPATKKIDRQTEEEEPVQAKLNRGKPENITGNLNAGIQAESKGSNPRDKLENMINETKGMGMALPDDIRAEMEGKFMADFSMVRIHTGEKAIIMTNMINAQAFTHGYDIYFNAGKYQPYSSEGKHLLAHELTHVVQQKG